MEKQKLRELLQQLHDELEGAEKVEPEARNLLEDVMGDIHGALERSTPGDGGTPAPSSVNERLRQAVVDFENSHPKLSFTIERIMDSLAAIGI